MPSYSHYPDGVTRLDAYKRLLATCDPPVRVWSPRLWIARLRALSAVLWHLWGRA